MKQTSISIQCFLLISLAAGDSFAQQKVQNASRLSNIYIGSTPCDSIIRTQIGILVSAKCDFINWQLTFESGGADSFQLKASYGESKPNTNGFIKAEEFMAKGRYHFSGSEDSPNPSILKLISPQFKSPVLLIVMDRNVLHFADQYKRFLVGNGSWGYVLNSVKIH